MPWKRQLLVVMSAILRGFPESMSEDQLRDLSCVSHELLGNQSTNSQRPQANHWIVSVSEAPKLEDNDKATVGLSLEST